MPGKFFLDLDVSAQSQSRKRHGTARRDRRSSGETASRSPPRCTSTAGSSHMAASRRVRYGEGWVSKSPTDGCPGAGFRERTRLLEFPGCGFPGWDPGPVCAMLRGLATTDVRCHCHRARTSAAPNNCPHLLGGRSRGATSHRPRRRRAGSARGALSAAGVSRNRGLPRPPWGEHPLRSILDSTLPKSSRPRTWQRSGPGAHARSGLWSG